MPEPITLSVIAVSALTGLAGDFLKGVAKKSAAGLKELFKGDESRAILNDAFQEFKVYCFNENSSTEEKILLQVFAEFFTDDRTIREFQLVFAGQSHQVDFNLMEEIFVGICIENKIEIPKFEFFRGRRSDTGCRSPALLRLRGGPIGAQRQSRGNITGAGRRSDTGCLSPA